MSSAAQIVGMRFGRLVVIGRHGSDKQKHATWKCTCDCGGSTVLATSLLRCGRVVSCGCWRAESSSIRAKEVNYSARFWASNPDRKKTKEAKEETRKSCRIRSYLKHVGGLKDSYIADLLRKSNGIPRAAIPKTLIDLKREHLRLVRELKEKKA